MVQETILLVDDEPHILELLSVALEGEKYRILRAKNGKEALIQFKKEKPYLVLLDIRMPDLDGLEVLRQMKESNQTSAL